MKKTTPNPSPHAPFDYEAYEQTAIHRLSQGHKLEDVFAPIIKRIVEGCLDSEMSLHLAESKSEGIANRRNGHNEKQLITQYGSINIDAPRDREGTFQPSVLPKRERHIGDGFEKKILSLVGSGMSYSDIQRHLRELYSVDISEGQLTHITDSILPLIEEWRNRPLETVYAIVWLDAIHFKVRHEGRVEKRAVYSVIGLDCKGRKEVLGIYTSENEGARFWMQVLTNLQKRGVEDIFIACIDNLTGFADAIETIFPKTTVQLCIVHQVRNSTLYVGSKHQKEFLVDLKKVYKADDIAGADYQFKELKTKWNKQYPVVIESWERNWDRLTEYFEFPAEIRRIMYTTNTVEGYHRQVRKVTKTKGAFTSENALIKLLYLCIERISEKWTNPVQNWATTYSQLNIIFPGRLPRQ
jgi:putative transposase